MVTWCIQNLRWDGSRFTWHQPCNSQIALSVHHFGGYPKMSAQFWWILKNVLYNTTVTHSEPHVTGARWVCSRAENNAIEKRLINTQLTVKVISLYQQLQQLLLWTRTTNNQSTVKVVSLYNYKHKTKGTMPSPTLAFQPGTLCHLRVCEQRVQPYSMTLFHEIFIAIISESEICKSHTRYRHQTVSCTARNMGYIVPAAAVALPRSGDPHVHKGPVSTVWKRARSKHIKGSKECLFIRTQTICKFWG